MTWSENHTFSDTFAQYDWDTISAEIRAKTAADVERALGKRQRDLQDFMALISSAAKPYLETMAQETSALTRQRFGNTMQLYAPIYVHNECQNVCNYCGFSLGNKMERKVLDRAEMEAEAVAVKDLGFEHVLLVSGETSKLGVDYFADVLDIFAPHFSQISLEVQPLEAAEYARLMEHQLHAVLVYQETYHEATYTNHHKAGKKRNFHYRLQTPDRLGQVGMRKIGLGALIGLEEWRTDAFMVKAHLDYLSRRYWRSRFTLSFPRLRPFAGGTHDVDMNDAEFVQLICAHRLCDPDVELSLSTRERAAFRDHLWPIGFTTASAGSKTDPGGYANPKVNLEQFEISDERSPAVVADAIRAAGLEPVWRDWSPLYT